MIMTGKYLNMAVEAGDRIFPPRVYKLKGETCVHQVGQPLPSALCLDHIDLLTLLWQNLSTVLSLFEHCLTTQH